MGSSVLQTGSWLQKGAATHAGQPGRELRAPAAWSNPGPLCLDLSPVTHSEAWHSSPNVFFICQKGWRVQMFYPAQNSSLVW